MALTVTDYFVTRKSQFHKNILGRLTRGNPFRNLIPMSPFDLSEGQVPEVLTLVNQLPSAYPTSLTQVPTITDGDNSGLSSASPCNLPASTEIKTGFKKRTFQLYGASFKSPVFCLSDIKRKHQAVQQAQFLERALSQYLTVWWSDWYRIQNIAMCDNKVGTLANGAVDMVDSQTADFSELSSLPTTQCSWDHLQYIYWEMIRKGIADELAIGTANGQPVMPVIASPAYIKAFTKGNDDLKTTIDYYKPAENLKALGIREAINGIAFIPDLFPVRIGDVTDTSSTTTGDNDTTAAIDHVDELIAENFIYPTIDDTASTIAGTGHKLNPNWKTSANGGKAQFEVIQFLPRNVWEAQYEPVDPTSFAGLNFNPKTDYVGNFNLINTPTFGGENDRGNLAYYLADVRVAAKPKYTDLGVTLLTTALD